MGFGKITQKQQEILDYIKDEILKKGYPPTVREICETVNLKSTSSVHSHLETLEKNGYIRRDPTKPRAIEICDDSFQMVRTACLVVIGELFFRAEGLQAGFQMFGKMVTDFSFSSLNAQALETFNLDFYDIAIVLFTIAVIFVISIFNLLTTIFF